VIIDSLVISDLLAQTLRPEFSWTPLRPGVDQHPVYGTDDGSGSAASILRYAPGARVPYHRHDGHEHVYILAGSQRDERGTYRAGTLVINLPGSSHDVVSDDGCTALLVWERPIVFTEG
jgi:anti-sigma factor ChrR (cupin superfamily)